MSETQDSPTTLICCFEGCETQLAIVSNNQAKALRPHIICETCRSILICQDHYRLLRNSGHTTCPACNVDNWRRIRDDEPHLPIRMNRLWRFNYLPVFIDDIPASAKLDYRGVSLMPTAKGAIWTNQVVVIAFKHQPQYLTSMYLKRTFFTSATMRNIS